MMGPFVDVGDEVTVIFTNGSAVRNVLLDDRVYPDRTCGQVDAGWWAFTNNPGAAEKGSYEWFVAFDGRVYFVPTNEYVGDVSPSPCSDFRRRCQQ